MSRMQETEERHVQSLVQEDSLEEEMATHSGILALENSSQRSLAGYTHGVKKNRTRQGTYMCMYVVVVQSLSCVRLFETPWTAAHQASLSFIISWSLLKLMSVESVMPSDHPVLHRPLLLLPSIFPSIGVFSNEPALCSQVAKVLELQLQHQSFQ